MKKGAPTALGEIRATLSLAGPVVVVQLSQMSMGLADTIMVGKLGKDALAGVALGNSVFFFLSVVCMGVVMSVGPMVSQAFGAGNKETIERSLRQGFWLGAALTVPSFLILWNIEPFLRAIGQADIAVSGAMDYIGAIVWGFLPFQWLVALRGFFEGISRPWPVTAIMFVGVGVNVCANYVLMFGKLGFPALGLEGTGWASTIVFWFLVLTLCCYVAAAPSLKTYRIFSRIRRPDFDHLRELFRIGWPIGVSLGVEMGVFVLTALMLGIIGTTALAAHQLAIQCASFTFMVPLGVGMATSVRVGHAIGRNDLPGARRAGYFGVYIAAACMAVAGLAFWMLPRPIIGLFLGIHLPENAQVVELAVTLLGIAAVFQVFDGIQVSAAGALRGLKDTRSPMLIGFVSYWLIGFSTACILGFAFDLGAPGLWWGLVVGLAAAALQLSIRFHVLTEPGRENPETTVKVAPGV